MPYKSLQRFLTLSRAVSYLRCKWVASDLFQGLYGRLGASGVRHSLWQHLVVADVGVLYKGPDDRVKVWVRPCCRPEE